MTLTDTAIKSAKPQARPYKLADEKGMFLLVNPNGGKWWRFKYRVAGKEKLLALGTYPEVSLKEARDQRDKARSLLRSEKRDPSEVRKQEKREKQLAASNSFESVAREFIANQRVRRDEDYEKYALRRLQQNVFPAIGHRPIAEIEAPELLDLLRKMEARGVHEMTARVRQLCGQVFRYGIATGRCKRDPAADLKGALMPFKVKHIPAIQPKELPELFAKIADYDGEPVTRLALQFLAHTFVRTSELIAARWKEFDFQDALWTVPGPRMKMKNDHYVPLSKQALGILAELQAINGGDPEGYVFAAYNPGKHISENTMIYALYRLGYKGRMTGHGFRSLASTVLNEERERGAHSFSSDVIERQLDHCERDEIRGAYNRAQYLGQRQAMMQWYADYLERAVRRAES
jgi:integrase